MTNRLLVLCWHNVEGTHAFPVPPGDHAEGFADQLRFVRRFGSVVPLGEALGALLSGESLGPRSVALSFDDGYRDNLEVALPLLHGHDLPATVFLVPDYLDGGDAWWETLAWALDVSEVPHVTWGGQELLLRDDGDRRTAFRDVSATLKQLTQRRRTEEMAALLDRLDPPGHPREELFMGWDGAAELVRGGVEIGGHSAHHAILSRETPDDQLTDLRTSRRRLQEGLSISVDLLAYPNGTRADFDVHTVTAAREAGFSAALTTVNGWNRPETPRFEIRRVVVDARRGLRGLAAAARAWWAGR